MSAYSSFLTVTIVSVSALMAWMAVWSRRDAVGRHASMALFVLVIPLTVVCMIESQGWGKPLWAAYELDGSYSVLGSKMIVGQGIYVYLDIPAEPEPRSFVLPWDARTASELQRMLDRYGHGENGSIVMEFQHEWSWTWDTHAPQFHPPPQPRMMPSKPQPPEPENYERGA